MNSNAKPGIQTDEAKPGFWQEFTRKRLLGGIAQGLMAAVAAILAYLPTKPFGLREGFWASITAIAVLQTELGATENSARDQMAGAAIGGIVSAAFVAVAGQSLGAYALAVVTSMSVCWIFNLQTAARLAGSTATIIAMVPHRGTTAWMLVSRVAEVGCGLAVGLGVAWVVNGIRELRNARKVDRTGSE